MSVVVLFCTQLTFDLALRPRDISRLGIYPYRFYYTCRGIISIDARFYSILPSKLRIKVNKGAKIRKRYNQVPHLTQDTNGKVTNSQLDTTNESQEVSPFPAGYNKAYINRRAQRHSKHKTEKKKIHIRSTALERSVKYFTGGLKPV